MCGLQEQDQQGPPIPRCQRYNCARGASHGHVPPAPARSAARGAAARLLSAAASPRPGRAALRLALHHARARPRLDQMEVRLMLEAPKGAPWPCSLATQLNWLHLSGWQGSGVIEPIRGLGQCAAGAWVGWSSLGGGPVREFGDGTAQSGRHPTGAGKNAPSPELQVGPRTVSHRRASQKLTGEDQLEGLSGLRAEDQTVRAPHCWAPADALWPCRPHAIERSRP